MNTPILDLDPGTGALRGDLRPSETSPRPIPHPSERQIRRVGGRR